MYKVFRLLLVAAVMQLLSACFGEPDTGPTEVEWEHDNCKRCNMVLHDAYHAAQVRHHPADDPTKVYLFDDIGCALVWLEDKSWKDDPATEVWVSDYKTGAWLDARTAQYVGGQQTPMLYGLGAQSEATPDSVPFERAKQHIFAVEERLKRH